METAHASFGSGANSDENGDGVVDTVVNGDDEMSKRSRQQVHRERDSAQNNAKTLTLSTGITITLQPVSPFLIDKLQATFKHPEPPTYTITTAAGTTETHPHDSDSIKTATPEEQARWRAYLTSVRQSNRMRNERFTRLILARGVNVDIPNDGWDIYQLELGIEVPTDAIERKVHYIMTEVCGSANDLTAILDKIMTLGGVSKEALATARSSFRGATQRNGTGSDQPDTGTVEGVEPVQ